MKAFPLISLLTSLAMVLGLVFLPSTAFANGGPVTDEGREAYAQADTDVTIEQEVRESEVRTEERPVYEQRDREVVVEEREVRTVQREHWMYFMGRNALWGGIIGGLVGVGAYLVTGLQASPWLIAQFAGGGILIGAVTGVIEGLFAPDFFALEGAPDSVNWVQQEMPETVDVPVFQLNF